MTYSVVKTLTACAMVVVASCGGGGEKAPANSAYLNVSVSDFYFGTRDVGTTATQTIELANWSGDLYPLHNLTINGQNSEEFETSFAGGITLKPSEKVLVDLSFKPLSDGLKSAVLDIDYDIIAQVTEAQNVIEQEFYQAKSLEDQQNYSASMDKYQAYLDARPATINKKRAAIKLPVLAEGELYGSGEDFDQYLAALDKRDDGDTSAAIGILDSMQTEAIGSYLQDDAIYLKGYIQLIDDENYAAAGESMSLLMAEFPDSTYFDSALYSLALSLEELGKTEEALAKYQELIDRHRSDTWAAIKLNISKDNFVSRMWFSRANQGLDRLAS